MPRVLIVLQFPEVTIMSARSLNSLCSSWSSGLMVGVCLAREDKTFLGGTVRGRWTEADPMWCIYLAILVEDLRMVILFLPKKGKPECLKSYSLMNCRTRKGLNRKLKFCDLMTKIWNWCKMLEKLIIKVLNGHFQLLCLQFPDVSFCWWCSAVMGGVALFILWGSFSTIIKVMLSCIQILLLALAVAEEHF